MRASVLARLGHFPARVPLAPVVGLAVDEEGYTRTSVSYMVEDGERISAWLLTPHGTAPQGGWPALLALHQHAGQYDLGKSELVGLVGDPMHAYGRELCQRGYVVLCPDMLCFEERRPPQAVREANRMLDAGEYERFAFTSRIVAGSCLQTKYLHDLSCAIDLLTTLPEINPQRLGAIGHSLGGQETLWLMWYDARIVAAVSSCGFDLLSTIIRAGIRHNFALYVPGMLDVCDMDALVSELAPRAFLMTAGEADPIFPIDGVYTIVERAQQSYARQGVPERFEAILFLSGHAFPEAVKARAFAFLDQWLKQ